MKLEEQKEYLGQDFERTVLINGKAETAPSITIAREPFLLERYEFDKIIKGENFVLTIANVLLGASIGLFINMISKFIGSKFDSSIKFEKWEVFAFLIALVLMAICYLINKLLTSEKNIIVNKIKSHFEKS